MMLARIYHACVLLVAMMLFGCSLATDKRAERLTPEHIPEMVDPVEFQRLNDPRQQEGVDYRTMDLSAADEAVMELWSKNLTMTTSGRLIMSNTLGVGPQNSEHGQLGDPDRHELEELGIKTLDDLKDKLSEVGFVGRPIDLLPTSPPSDWHMWTDTRYARGSARDWAPIGSVNPDPPCIINVQRAPLPTTGEVQPQTIPLVAVDDAMLSVLIPPLDGQGIVFPLGSSGVICIDTLVEGRNERQCTTVDAFRQLLHGR